MESKQNAATATQLFAVSADGENVGGASAWDVQVQMPQHLQQRANTLQKRFATTDAEARMEQATLKHKENIENIRATAQRTISKGEQARQRKVAFGENMQLMGNVMGNQDQTVKLPKALQQRVQALAPVKKDDVEIQQRQEQAARNRAAALKAKKDTAHVAAERAAAAKGRKHQMLRNQQAEAGMFEVNLGDDAESKVTQEGGWGMPVKLPPHLSSRVAELKGRFQYDATARMERAARNRDAVLTSVKAKASGQSDKVAAAQSLKRLMAGDESHFTVTVESGAETKEVDSSQGWVARTALPGRLQDRIQGLAGKFAYDAEARQQQAQINRAAHLSAIAAKAAEYRSRQEAAQRRRALARGDACHFTVSAAATSESETKDDVTSQRGWKSSRPLPAHLAKRLSSLEGKFAYDAAAREKRAAKNRAAAVESIRSRARAENERVIAAQNMKQLIDGNANNFTVSLEAESKDAAMSTGWAPRPSLPANLEQRLTQLQGKFSYDAEAREQQAAANRAEFLDERRRTAKSFNDQVAQAQATRRLIQGDDSTFTVSAEEEGKADAQAGWAARTSLPNHLQRRISKLQSRFGTREPLETRQARAAANRAAAVSEIVGRAQDTTEKVTLAAQRRHLANGDEAHFTVVATDNDADDAVIQQRGWGYKVPVPPRLMARLGKLKQRFQHQDTTTKQARAAEARSSFINGIKAKAQGESEKVEQAQARRAIVNGSASIFTVQADEEQKDESTSQGWGVPVALPPRLSARVESLRTRFAYDAAEREVKAAQNREAHLQKIRLKAKSFSGRVQELESKRKLATGDETCFTVQFSQETKDAGTTMGWGPQISPTLPRRLARRAAKLLRESPEKNPFESMLRAQANRDRYLETIISKARRSIAKLDAAREKRLERDLSDGIVLLNTQDQRALSPVKLPKRLAKRCEQLTTRFGYDGLEREQRVAENRQRRLQEIKMKAQRAAVRAEEARIRRAQQTNVPGEVVEEAKKSICNRTRDECTIC